MKGDFPETIEYGLCHCGCGKRTNISEVNRASRGWIKDEPKRFVNGHNSIGKNASLYGKTGKDCPHWKGGRKIQKNGNTNCVLIYMPRHPRSDHQGYVKEHILIIEKMTGKPLPDGAVVHHRDGNGENNDKENLMVFPSNAEHSTFHRKERALKACGHTDWRKCSYCGMHDSVENLYMNPGGKSGYHKECKKKYCAKRYKMKK